MYELFKNLVYKLIIRWIPDSFWIKVYFRKNMGYWPNLKSPSSFNEKLNWLKLNDHNPLYSKLVDKYAVKKWVEEKIGKQYVVPTFGVWNDFDDIDFEKLPNSFVLKCTHDSSGTFVVKENNKFDLKRARNKIRSALKRNYYWVVREWPYKNVKPRIIADQYLDDKVNPELLDYKFWCFNGNPVYMYITNKGAGIFENFYDMDYNIVEIDHGFPRHKPEFDCPKDFELMKTLAKKLSTGIPFSRVDFFYVNEKIYFGEMTFYDWGGVRAFGNGWDLKLGKLLSLPTDSILAEK